MSFGFRLYSEAYGLIPDITRSSFLLSTSNTKLKLPVHPNVPTNTAPCFSSDFPSNERWKKEEQNILARAPNLVSIVFLPNSKGCSFTCASLAQSPENSVRK